MQAKIISVIPVQGYGLVWMDGKTPLPSEPIIAFAVWAHEDGDVTVLPVLPEMAVDPETPQAFVILYPNGAVCRPHDRIWSSWEAFRDGVGRG